MLWFISFSLQAVWFYLLLRWTKSAGKKMEEMQDQIAQLSIDQVGVDKQLHDMWIALGDLETIVSDRDSRARASTPKRRKK
jgi:hypothetical protein